MEPTKTQSSEAGALHQARKGAARPRSRPVNLDQATELALREEIRATQAVEADLAKWKLLAVAAVGSISLGLLGGNDSATIQVQPQQVLCLVPLICAYTDLICLHYILRIITIGAFIRDSYEKAGGKLRDYETFVFALRGTATANPFRFERWATVGSTVAINAIFFVISLGLLATDQQDGNIILQLALVFLPLCGIVGAILMLRAYGSRYERICEEEVWRPSAKAKS